MQTLVCPICLCILTNSGHLSANHKKPRMAPGALTPRTPSPQHDAVASTPFPQLSTAPHMGAGRAASARRRANAPPPRQPRQNATASTQSLHYRSRLFHSNRVISRTCVHDAAHTHTLAHPVTHASAKSSKNQKRAVMMPSVESCAHGRYMQGLSHDDGRLLVRGCVCVTCVRI